MQVRDEVGSAAWVRDRLRVLPSAAGWVESTACQELIAWLYAVARRRAAGAGVPGRDRDEVAQDAMPVIVAALGRSRVKFARAGNPAAVLERVVARAVSCAAHRNRMRGLGGVSANGRNWHEPYPRSIGGDAAARLLEDFPASDDPPCKRIEDAAADVAEWVADRVGVALTVDGVHAVTYVLDRLACGLTRGPLVRGDASGLASDPAMRHLGFEAAGARAFARWLLGRRDAGHERPSVLDAALLGEPVSPKVLAGWRETALGAGFAREQTDAAVIPLPTEPARASRHIA